MKKYSAFLVFSVLIAGLAQAGCANHFAGFHIGLCVGNGWIAGRSAVQDLDSTPVPKLDTAEVQALHDEANAPLDTSSKAESDRILRALNARRADGRRSGDLE